MKPARARPPLTVTLAALVLAAALFGIVVGGLIMILGLTDQYYPPDPEWGVFLLVATGVIAAIVASTVATIAGLPFALLAHLALRRIGTGPLGISTSSVIAMAGCFIAVLVFNFDGGDRSFSALVSGPGGWFSPLLISAAGLATASSWLILRRLSSSRDSA